MRTNIRERVIQSKEITPFQRRVYLELLNVPKGETITYGELAHRIGCRSAQAVGADPLSFCVALMIAVSCCFATPVGSPRHMLIYGPGGYRFADFLRVGLPMDIIILAADIFIVSILFPPAG